jgi:hypothetical protein
MNAGMRAANIGNPYFKECNQTPIHEEFKNIIVTPKYRRQTARRDVTEEALQTFFEKLNFFYKGFRTNVCFGFGGVKIWRITEI